MQTPTLNEIDALLATSRFSDFVRLMWPGVSNDRFVSGYHIEAICDHLQAVGDGQIKRLCVLCPIRHTKSLLSSVLFPVWLHVRDQSERIITATYSQQLTVRDAIRSRQLIESELFQKYFPPIKFNDDTNRKDYYANTSKGHRLSVSIGSRTSGFDATKIVVDDLHDFATRASQTERDKACDYFETALCSRLVYTGNEAIVVAGHRVHEDDVYARLRAKYGDDGEWTWLVLPTEYTPKFATWYNALNWKDTRQEGELLWPERFNRETVKQEKKRYRHEFSAIFNQEPTPAEGTLFKPEWFRHYTETDTHYVLGSKRLPKAGAWRFATVDTAISTNPDADYTVCQVWDLIGSNLILVHQLRKKLDGTKIVGALLDVWNTYRPEFMAIEKQFVGQFIIDRLRDLDVLVKPFDAMLGQEGVGATAKERRAVSAEIRTEAGQVWFPADKEWVGALESELLAFPFGSHDDQVDALSMAATLMSKYASAEPVELTPEQEQAKKQAEADEKFQRLLWAGGPRIPQGAPRKPKYPHGQQAQETHTSEENHPSEGR